MYEADSKWIYDNCPEGTIVQVVGRHAIRTGTLTRYAWRGCAAFAYAVQWAA